MPNLENTSFKRTKFLEQRWPHHRPLPPPASLAARPSPCRGPPRRPSRPAPASRVFSLFLSFLVFSRAPAGSVKAADGPNGVAAGGRSELAALMEKGFFSSFFSLVSSSSVRLTVGDLQWTRFKGWIWALCRRGAVWPGQGTVCEKHARGEACCQGGRVGGHYCQARRPDCGSWRHGGASGNGRRGASLNWTFK